MINFYAFPLLQIPPGGPETFELTHILALVGNAINIALLLASAIAVIYIIVGAYQYITSFGDPEGIVRAKQTLTWAIIGFIIVIAAIFIITYLWNHFIGGELPGIPK